MNDRVLLAWQGIVCQEEGTICGVEGHPLPSAMWGICTPDCHLRMVTIMIVKNTFARPRPRPITRKNKKKNKKKNKNKNKNKKEEEEQEEEQKQEQEQEHQHTCFYEFLRSENPFRQEL